MDTDTASLDRGVYLISTRLCAMFVMQYWTLNQSKLRDLTYKNTVCEWDGDYCCRSSCDAEFGFFQCGRDEQPYDCKNPDIIYQFGYVP